MPISITDASCILEKAEMIYIIGDGGSAAMADHFACDLLKNCGLRAISLCSNAALITAIGNDISFEEIFKKQLQVLYKAGDLLVIFTTSGTSKNLVSACECVDKSLLVSGNGGGHLRQQASYFLDLDSIDKMLSEDKMSWFCHSVVRLLRKGDLK